MGSRFSTNKDYSVFERETTGGPTAASTGETASKVILEENTAERRFKAIVEAYTGCIIAALEHAETDNTVE